jgi:hypothetical protein
MELLTTKTFEQIYQDAEVAYDNLVCQALKDLYSTEEKKSWIYGYISAYLEFKVKKITNNE